MPDKLFADFGITGDVETRREALRRLHGDVAPVKESWEVIRRVYRLAPVIGATKEELREWSIEEIAKEAGVPVKRIESIIEETKVFWARKCNERSLVTRAVEGPTVEALGDLDDEQIAKLLSKHGFEEVPPNYQRYMARRIVEFQHLLDDEQGAHLARSALMQELILLEYDREIRRMCRRTGLGGARRRSMTSCSGGRACNRRTRTRWRGWARPRSRIPATGQRWRSGIRSGIWRRRCRSITRTGTMRSLMGCSRRRKSSCWSRPRR